MPQIVKVYPPDVLTAPVSAPEWRGKTNGDLLEYAQDLETALDMANTKLTAIGKLKAEDADMGKAE